MRKMWHHHFVKHFSTFAWHKCGGADDDDETRFRGTQKRADNDSSGKVEIGKCLIAPVQRSRLQRHTFASNASFDRCARVPTHSAACSITPTKTLGTRNFVIYFDDYITS